MFPVSPKIGPVLLSAYLRTKNAAFALDRLGPTHYCRHSGRRLEPCHHIPLSPGSRATGVGEGSSKEGVAIVRKDLSELYWEAHGYEGLDIERFLADVQAGTWGAYTADEIRDFLYKLEAAIIDNIETKATEAPAFAAAKNEIIEQTKARFAELRRRYASSV